MGLYVINYGFPFRKIVHSIPKEPRRVTACGFQTGLSVILTPRNNDYHTTVVGSYGFRVHIHDAYDYPDQNSESRVITSRLESFFSIAPGENNVGQ